MLTFLILTPLIGVIILLPINDITKQQQIRIKQISLIITLIAFILSIILWIIYDTSTTGYQFVQSYTTLGFCHFHVGIDTISLYYIILTAILIPISLLAS